MGSAYEQTNSIANCFEQAVGAIQQQSVSQLAAALSKSASDIIVAVDHQGRSLLHWAVIAGTDGILEEVLKHLSAYCNTQPATVPPSEDDQFLQLMLSPDSVSHQSPMVMAITGNSAMKVYLLIKYNPWAIVWTAHKEDQDAVAIAMSMLKGPKKSKLIEVLNAMLVGAIESTNPLAPSFIKRLLSSGAATDAWAPNGLSALMSASSTNQTEVMALLMSGIDDQKDDRPQQAGAGADLHLADAQGLTALMHAASSNSTEAVQLLLAHGAQVSATDLSSRNPVDYCKNDSKAFKILSHHMHCYARKAEAMAAALPQVDAASNLSPNGKSRWRSKGGGGNSRQFSSSHASAKHPGNGSSQGSTESPELAAFCTKMKPEECGGEENSRIACEIGSDPAPAEQPADVQGPAAPCDVQPFQSATEGPNESEGPWQTVETRAAHCRRWQVSQSHEHCVHSQHAGELACASLGHQPREEAMSTFKQLFYIRDCSAATQGPSSRTPDEPSFNGSTSDRGVGGRDDDDAPCQQQQHDGKLEEYPLLSRLNVQRHEPEQIYSGQGLVHAGGIDDAATSADRSLSSSPCPSGTVLEADRTAENGESCTALSPRPSTAAFTARGPRKHEGRHHDAIRHEDSRTTLVENLAAQVVLLQQKMDIMESKHRSDMHEAVWETVQQMEARVMDRCAHLAVQLTWDELHRTGLAALYSGVVQGAVRPDALKAATTQCLSGTGRPSPTCARLQSGPHHAPPPPPPGPPPAHQGLSPLPRQSPTQLIQPHFVAPSGPPPPGPPPHTPPPGPGGDRVVLGFHANHQPQMSPLSHSHRAPQGGFSALAKPFSPVACDWNGPSSAWAMNRPPPPAPPPEDVHSSGDFKDCERDCVPKISCAVSLRPPDLQLPDSLPGSIE